MLVVLAGWVGKILDRLEPSLRLTRQGKVREADSDKKKQKGDFDIGEFLHRVRSFLADLEEVLHNVSSAKESASSLLVRLGSDENGPLVHQCLALLCQMQPVLCFDQDMIKGLVSCIVHASCYCNSAVDEESLAWSSSCLQTLFAQPLSLGDSAKKARVNASLHFAASLGVDSQDVLEEHAVAAHQIFIRQLLTATTGKEGLRDSERENVKYLYKYRHQMNDRYAILATVSSSPRPHYCSREKEIDLTVNDTKKLMLFLLSNPRNLAEDDSYSLGHVARAMLARDQWLSSCVKKTKQLMGQRHSNDSRRSGKKRQRPSRNGSDSNQPSSSSSSSLSLSDGKKDDGERRNIKRKKDERSSGPPRRFYHHPPPVIRRQIMAANHEVFLEQMEGFLRSRVLLFPLNGRQNKGGDDMAQEAANGGDIISTKSGSSSSSSSSSSRYRGKFLCDLHQAHPLLWADFFKATSPGGGTACARRMRWWTRNGLDDNAPPSPPINTTAADVLKIGVVVRERLLEYVKKSCPCCPNILVALNLLSRWLHAACHAHGLPVYTLLPSSSSRLRLVSKLIRRAGLSSTSSSSYDDDDGGNSSISIKKMNIHTDPGSDNNSDDLMRAALLYLGVGGLHIKDLDFLLSYCLTRPQLAAFKTAIAPLVDTEFGGKGVRKQSSKGCLKALLSAVGHNPPEEDSLHDGNRLGKGELLFQLRAIVYLAALRPSDDAFAQQILAGLRSQSQLFNAAICSFSTQAVHDSRRFLKQEDAKKLHRRVHDALLSPVDYDGNELHN
eukprot:jgi/Bigna1/81439/fgenesh1_pg.80_\